MSQKAILSNLYVQMFGSSRSPRAKWVALSGGLFFYLVIASVALPFLLAAYRQHPISAPIGAMGCVLFAMVDYQLSRWRLRTTIVWAARFQSIWALVGFVGVMVIYEWTVRGSERAVYASLWPVL